MAFAGDTKSSNTLSVHHKGNVGPGQTGTVGDTAFASLSVPLMLGASPMVTFSSFSATQVTAGATVKTFGSASVVYDYTPIGQSEQGPIPAGNSVNGVYFLAVAPSGRWFNSPAAARVRYNAASAADSLSSIQFPSAAIHLLTPRSSRERTGCRTVCAISSSPAAHFSVTTVF